MWYNDIVQLFPFYDEEEARERRIWSRSLSREGSWQVVGFLVDKGVVGVGQVLSTDPSNSAGRTWSRPRNVAKLCHQHNAGMTLA